MTESFVRYVTPRSLAPHRTTLFDARRTMSSVVIVSAHGDIDGTNASTLTDFAVVNAMYCRGLIIDLCGVEFIGTEGFSALLKVSDWCAQAGTGWVVVPSAAVSRLLRICDPHGSLPAIDTVDAALANLLEQHGGCVIAAPPPGQLACGLQSVGKCQSVDGC